jgi:hypothetical protein
MANFKFPKKVFIDINVDERALNYEDTSLLGEGIAYVLNGRKEWAELVNTLYDDETDWALGVYIINKLTYALEDTLHFQKIFAK